MRSGQRLTVIAAVGIALLIFMRQWFAPPSPEEAPRQAAAFKSPDTPFLSGAVLSVTPKGLELKNQSDVPWPDVTVGISESPAFRSTYLLYVGTLEPAHTVTRGLNEFADFNDRRFDPFSLKVRRAMVVAFLSSQKQKHVAYFRVE